MSEWQPIETAPKDGRLILIWPYWGNNEPAAVSWRDMKRTPGRWEITPSFYCITAKPTHWQPLPSPPDSSLTDPSTMPLEDRE